MKSKRSAMAAGERGVGCILFLAVSGFFSISAAQSTTSADTSQSTKAATAKQAAAPDAKKAGSTDLQKLVKDHKVITNEDFEGMHSNGGGKYRIEERRELPSADAGQCDEECAEEARERLGMGPSREGEWQAQLAAAKQYLATDAEWRDGYRDGMQRVKTYCTFQRQQQLAPPPSGNDFPSQYERAKRDEYVSSMNRTLSMGVQSASARLNRMIDEAQNVDPARAAIMSVLAERVLGQCADPSDP